MKNGCMNVKNVLTTVVVVATLFYAADFALAEEGFANPLGNSVTSISGLLIKIIRWLLGVSALLAMLALVVGGIRMIVSFGNDQGVAAAKKNIQWAVIGVVVILLSYAIITLISDLLGVAS